MLTRLKAYTSSSQFFRDSICLVLLILACMGYEYYLRAYLSGLAAQVQLSIAFSGSLVFALVYEFKKRDWRGSLVRMATIALIFMLAALLAPHLRHEVFHIIEDARSNPAVVKAVTAEGLTLLSNPLAGFGGCFGISVMAIRVLGGWLLVRTLSALVQHDATCQACPHCQKPVPR